MRPQDVQGRTYDELHFHVDADGFVVGEIELPGGLPPEEPETDDEERA